VRYDGKNTLELLFASFGSTPMSQLRDEAEALATALNFGICDVAEVIVWSDTQILREESAPTALCDVSLSHDCYPQDVAASLRQCPGTPDRSRAQRLFLLLVRDKLRKDSGCADKIASALFQMALADEIEDRHLKSVAWWAWDALDLADAGHGVESRKQITDQMAAELDAATKSGEES
jgi:hypothetical protein